MNVAAVVKLKHDERVVRVVRRFWLVYAFRVLLALILVLAPFFFMVPLYALGVWGSAIFIGSVGLGLVYGSRVYIIAYWNSFVITTVRIIDIDRRGFFELIISESPYDKVQNVAYRTQGFFGTILNYGAVLVQNFGTTSQLELRDVRSPKNIHHLITEMVDIHRRSHGEVTDSASELVDDNFDSDET